MPPRFPAGRARAREFGRRSRVSAAGGARTRATDRRPRRRRGEARGDRDRIAPRPASRKTIDAAANSNTRADAEDGPRTPRQRRRARADAGETFARERTTTNTATGAWRGTVADPIPPRRRRLCLAVPLEAMAGWARAFAHSTVRAGRVSGRNGRVRGGASPSIRVGTPIAFDGRDARRRIRGSGTRAEDRKRGRVEIRVPFAVGSAAAVEEGGAEVETAIDYLSMLTAALHFAAAAVAFAVLVVAVTANARSSGSLAARLDRIDLAMKGGVPTAAPGVFRGRAREGTREVEGSNNSPSRPRFERRRRRRSCDEHAGRTESRLETTRGWNENGMCVDCSILSWTIVRSESIRFRSDSIRRTTRARIVDDYAVDRNRSTQVFVFFPSTFVSSLPRARDSRDGRVFRRCSHERRHVCPLLVCEFLELARQVVRRASRPSQRRRSAARAPGLSRSRRRRNSAKAADTRSFRRRASCVSSCSSPRASARARDARRDLPA